MKTSPTKQARNDFSFTPASTSLVAAVVLLSAAIFSSQAQTVVMRADPTRLTIPRGVSQSNFTTVTIVTTALTNAGDQVNLAVTGVPAGVLATLSTNFFTNSGTFTATLAVVNDTTVAQGAHDLAIEATGTAGYRLPIPIICGYIWSGENFTNATSTNWASAGNWLGGVVPGSTDSVIIRDLGGVGSTAGATNIIISANTEIGSLRFAQQAGATRTHNVELQSGATLSVTGPGGFSILKDAKNNGQAIDVRFAGNGKLVISNAAANFASVINEQALLTLDLAALDNLYVDVNRIGFGDYRLYPNFGTNGYNGVGSGGANNPSRFYSINLLARTNVLKASGVDPNNYQPAGGVRDYSLVLAHNEGQSTGSGQAARLALGFSNAFFMDSICISQGGVANGSGGLRFNSPGSYALFRNADGGRMSVWTIGDGDGPVPNSGATRGLADLSLGTVDALVDRLYLGRDRTNVISAQNQTLQGTLTLASGTFDVNTAYVGMQEQGDQLGTGTTSGPEGIVNVNTNAVFKVNGNLHLGYTTATTVAAPNSAQLSFGRLTIGTGTAMISNVVVGGITKLSVNNAITIGGGRLIVTNDIGAADGPLNSFVSSNGSRWVLHSVGADRTNIFVRTLNVPVVGAKTRVDVPSLANVTTYPVTIPVISYVTDSPVYNGLDFGTLPSGVVGISIVEDSAKKVINFTFDTNQPKVLVWRGNESADWDTVTTNWVTQSSGTPAKFTDGDSVIFDDTAKSSSSSVNIVGTVVPGQTAAPNGVIVSNSILNYSFGGGNIAGGATLRKIGPGTLTIDASTSMGVELLAGSLTGVGSVGPTYAGFGANLTGFLGGISGGLTVSNATAAIAGTVSGGLALHAGALTNNGTINGNVVLTSGSVLDNASAINVTLPWNIPTNAVVINNGTILQTGPPGGGQGLTVNGALLGTGRITQNGFQAAADVRVTMNPGSTLTIGNSPNEITNMTIAVRLDLIAGSTTTFDVDNSTAANDRIQLTDGFIQGKVNFGAGNNLGANLIVNRTAGPAFGPATVLNLFDLTSNNPDNGSPAIPGVTPPPALGLAWDLSQMLTNLTLQVAAPASVTNTFTGTNLIFSWPESRLGWRLERQTNSLAVGLEPGGTNWTTVFLSLAGTNSLFYPDTNDLSIFHFRSVQPINTNLPAVFYRLTYP